jgi:hypothetical protein
MLTLRNLGSITSFLAAAAAAVFLPAGAVHAVGPDAQEMTLLAENPDLYALARRYFPADATRAPARRLFRLTRDQIDATVASLLPGLALTSVKSVVARDPLQTNYEYADVLALNAANIAPYTNWVAEIATRVRSEPHRVIDCPAASASDNCLDEKSRRFAQRAFRGDVEPRKLDRIAAFYTAGVRTAGLAQATGDLVEVVLNSPDFLFRKEIATGPDKRLSPAQLLQSVSYTLTDTPPERFGLDGTEAVAGLGLAPDKSRRIQALVQSRESREKLVRFFKAWLEIKAPGEFTISPEVFPEFTPALEAAMLADADRFLRAATTGAAPTLRDITDTAHAFISKPLTAIYGVAPADATGRRPTALDPNQRRGIFSLPAVIASHSGPAGTRPIKRGVFFARKIMCMDLEPPPKDLHAELYEMKGATERQRIEGSTKGAACIGCHKIINPLGFFQESFDTLGRWRAVENDQPIDTSLVIDFLDEGKTATRTGVEALSTLTRSALFKQCFVRQLFRFYTGRQEEPSDDPLLRRMFLEFVRNDRQDLLSMVYMLAVSDRIATRE